MYQRWNWSLAALGALGALHTATGTPVQAAGDLLRRGSLNGNHSAATAPFWEGYTYCQGKTILPFPFWAQSLVLNEFTGRNIDPSTYQPVKDAKLVKLIEM